MEYSAIQEEAVIHEDMDGPWECAKWGKSKMDKYIVSFICEIYKC